MGKTKEKGFSKSNSLLSAITLCLLAVFGIGLISYTSIFPVVVKSNQIVMNYDFPSTMTISSNNTIKDFQVGLFGTAFMSADNNSIGVTVQLYAQKDFVNAFISDIMNQGNVSQSDIDILNNFIAFSANSQNNNNLTQVLQGSNAGMIAMLMVCFESTSQLPLLLVSYPTSVISEFANLSSISDIINSLYTPSSLSIVNFTNPVNTIQFSNINLDENLTNGTIDCRINNVATEIDTMNLLNVVGSVVGGDNGNGGNGGNNNNNAPEQEVVTFEVANNFQNATGNTVNVFAIDINGTVIDENDVNGLNGAIINSNYAEGTVFTNLRVYYLNQDQTPVVLDFALNYEVGQENTILLTAINMNGALNLMINGAPATLQQVN